MSLHLSPKSGRGRDFRPRPLLSLKSAQRLCWKATPFSGGQTQPVAREATLSPLEGPLLYSQIMSRPVGREARAGTAMR